MRAELHMRRFTPMLPSTAVGTVEFRSLCEPIRTSNRFVEYVGATCEVQPLLLMACSMSVACASPWCRCNPEY